MWSQCRNSRVTDSAAFPVDAWYAYTWVCGHRRADLVPVVESGARVRQRAPTFAANTVLLAISRSIHRLTGKSKLGIFQ